MTKKRNRETSTLESSITEVKGEHHVRVTANVFIGFRTQGVLITRLKSHAGPSRLRTRNCHFEPFRIKSSRFLSSGVSASLEKLDFRCRSYD